MSVEVNIKSLKQNGFFMILLDLVILASSIERNRGIIFTALSLKYIVLEFIIYIITYAWWAADLKKCIEDKQRRKLIWPYILFEVAMLLGIALLTMEGRLMAASVLVYVLALYCIFGIRLFIRYI